MPTQSPPPVDRHVLGGVEADPTAVLPFQRPVLAPAPAIEAYYAQSRAMGWYANRGPCHVELERRASALLHHRSVVPVSSAGMGLVIALRALVGEPDARRRQVIVPSFTFAASAAAIAWSGLEPVFCDIERDSWNMCPDRLREALDDRRGHVAAVLACASFGTPPPKASAQAWVDAANDAGVPLVVDSAAGLGSSLPDGPLPDAEVFSMHATKPMPVGEGGLVALREERTAVRVRTLSNHGIDENHMVVSIGLNAKLDEWHCAAALAGLDDLDATLASRRSRAAALRQQTRDLNISFQHQAELSTVQFIPAVLASAEERTRLLRVAELQGIQLRTYFDPPLHLTPAFSGFAQADDLSVTEELAQRIVSLPMATDMTDREIERVVRCLRLCA